MNEKELDRHATISSPLFLNKDLRLNVIWNSQSLRVSHTWNPSNNQSLRAKINLKLTRVNLKAMPLKVSHFTLKNCVPSLQTPHSRLKTPDLKLPRNQS
ncbi:hypothetical protein IAD21_05934 [Abditibacteriota bacterium]|nr:hypothetical protein IAD21_05934 [Abditibacteriota bacterium]